MYLIESFYTHTLLNIRNLLAYTVLLVFLFVTPQQLHASTPDINWRTWSKQSLEISQKNDKPVFLYLSAVWCMNCHIFERSVLSNNAVSDFINKNFIAIKVDADDRPDLSERFIHRGLPTFAFLMPSGDIIVRGNNIPLYNFKKTMHKINSLYTHNRIKILNAIKNRKEKLSAEHVEKNQKKMNISLKLVNDVRKILIEDYDNKHYGFGESTKYPLPYNLEFIVNLYLETNNKELKNIFLNTINAINNALYDTHEAGYYRYSTQRDWSSPHYEKILTENTRILNLLLTAYTLSKDNRYKTYAANTINYILQNFHNKKLSLFYYSQDAEDGSYYKLDSAKRKLRKTPNIDKRIFSGANAEFATLLLRYAKIFNDKKYEKYAFAVWDSLQSFKNEKYLIRHEYNQSSILLQDQLDTATLALALYQHSKNPNYLDYARSLSSKIYKHFWGEQASSFTTILQNETLLSNSKLISLETNTRAAEFYLRLYRFSNKQFDLNIAKQTLLAINEVSTGASTIENVAIPKLASTVLLFKSLNKI